MDIDFKKHEKREKIKVLVSVDKNPYIKLKKLLEKRRVPFSNVVNDLVYQLLKLIKSKEESKS